MGKQCYICGTNTIFFIWTSSRAFPRHKLKLSKRDRVMYNIGVPICFRCFEKIKEEAYGYKTGRKGSKDD